MSKPKDAKDKEALDKVLKYMTDQNRPYSVGDVMNNMHKEFNKACIQRCLDQLVGLGKLKEKCYGKQKVYVIDQGIFTVVDEADISKMDQHVTKLQEDIKEQESECSAIETKLYTLQNSLTLEEAQKQLKDLNEEMKSLKERLTEAKAGSENVTKDEIDKIHHDHKNIVTHWRKRKRFTMDMVNAVLEGYPKSKKELLDEVGIETDEDYGLIIPHN